MDTGTMAYYPPPQCDLHVTRLDDMRGETRAETKSRPTTSSTSLYFYLQQFLANIRGFAKGTRHVYPKIPDNGEMVFLP